MAGRIREEDIKRVRDASPIADVIGEYLQLRPAGADNLRGLCPFHEERTPSFYVRPSRGVFYCFGCAQGGDVIAFVMKHDHLTFVEAVERLAGRAGIQLRYEEGSAAPRSQQSYRTRLLEAHKVAHEYFMEHLATPEAAPAREFLAERGFDAQVAEHFQLGYAPAGWENLVRHLRARRFTDKEILDSGLASPGRHGPMDRFRGRLIWPIKDLAGDVIGFGARRLDEHDTGPKYLNTPETPLYKKSQVLYGIELAKREIARRQQAVIVEGYTDVMACHLAGVPTAIATCGTAFGTEHIKILRRLIHDDAELGSGISRAQIIFTFDGDEAGRKAAERAFAEDQRFVNQTYVAIEPNGMDPCELRQHKGDAAVRELIAQRVPLYEFALRSTVDQYDLDTAEGQIAALDAAAPIVASIKDWSLRQRYAVRLSGWLGLPDEKLVLRRIGQQGRQGRGGRRAAPRPEPPGQGALFLVDPNDPKLFLEREALKLALQYPAHTGPEFDEIEPEAFVAEPYAKVRHAIAEAGGASSGVAGEAWLERVREHAPDDQVRSLVTELAVEPLRDQRPNGAGEPDPRYVTAILARVQERHVSRRIAEVKSRLQRVNPTERPDEHNRLFGELIALEQYRRGLLERGIEGL
ncbi:DNA primase [Carbonactinospora thermoautotrophica]|uniref:DNA primase n=1 Tax=Carbonactinospora thermoautotrophica TaxID=1469144 RepID=A0A132MVH1_9ACTN|nr:DNA primase [Carbonactinospora thermoautotrophica]KWX01908.1 DNA primase [Carbonactinospora thermoautotrophica]